ncbi:MAG TPA: hypothetical protein VJ729_06805, partial [Nitrososphaeraceae archaeon]|nr:hypothetical protein [Nitrososphaeraceae archaeon]
MGDALRINGKELNIGRHHKLCLKFIRQADKQHESKQLLQKHVNSVTEPFGYTITARINNTATHYLH